MSKKILITGITGQDGSYMSEYCLNLNHEVYGMVRRTSQVNNKNYKHLLSNPNFKVICGDLIDGGSIDSLVREIQPDYFINFAAQSFVGSSWQIPEETFMAGAVGVLKCLEAVRKYAPNCRFYNAGSSEQFGDVEYTPQDELHPFRPRSPYGAAKCAAHHLVKVYRESYGIYAVQGILFNHESERRGEEFVTRKITKGLARICKSIHNVEPFDPIRLGNLEALRDWSHAEDFVDGVWRMLNQDHFRFIQRPTQKEKGKAWNNSFVKSYILSSNSTYSIKDFINIAVKHANLDAVWVGERLDERLVLKDYLFETNNIKSSVLVVVDKAFYRPAEVNLLHGDSSLARKELDWKPKNSFDNLVKRMVESDLYEAGSRPFANVQAQKATES